MTANGGRLARIRRHPVKTLGGEDLAATDLIQGAALPGDRAFGVLHDDALRHLDGGALTRWLPKSAFLRGAAAPALQAVRSGWDGDRLWFTHPDRPDLSIDPDRDGDRLIAWLAPLWPAPKAPPARLVRGPQPLTDSRHPRLSILSLSSLAALEDRLGQPIGIERWRGNLWVDGWPVLAERDLIGQDLRIGGAVLRVVKPIERCPAVEVSADTGQRDGDMLADLTVFCGGPDFGIFAEVIAPGPIALNDKVTT
ncbi:MOSC domain-containing protein [Paracoccus sp. p4-l81]|uniref:MOSC domain-containing protein n=1 Tax=Paracoccus sp. p4-l81 TaxID=3342806 RepID=UPI0035B75D88